MSRQNIVVLGGGSGGIAAAAELGRRIGRDHNVILIDRNPFHVYMPAFLMVMTGDRTARDITRDLSRLERFDVRVIQSNIYGIDIRDNVVHLDGQKLPFDCLVMSLGLQTHLEAIPGFREGAQHPWELDGALRSHDALMHFAGGRIVVGLPPGPYRCPPAPFEMLYSIDGLLRRRGLREQSEIHYFASTPRPTGDPASIPVWLNDHAERLGVETHYGFTIKEIDPDARLVRSDEGEELPYELLFVVPPIGRPRCSLTAASPARTASRLTRTP